MMKVGDKVRLPSWEPGYYITVTKVKRDNFLGKPNWFNDKIKRNCGLDTNWYYLNEPWQPHIEPEQPLYLYRWQNGDGEWLVTRAYYKDDEGFKIDCDAAQYHRIEESKFVPPKNEE